MEELKVGAILMGLFGGLALFLYGMEKMTGALELVAGSQQSQEQPAPAEGAGS